jgi:hypothetical protein
LGISGVRGSGGGAVAPNAHQADSFRVARLVSGVDMKDTAAPSEIIQDARATGFLFGTTSERRSSEIQTQILA